ncbi:hypothetical protein ACFQXA_29580 [Nocardiopsis composta]
MLGFALALLVIWLLTRDGRKRSSARRVPTLAPPMSRAARPSPGWRRAAAPSAAPPSAWRSPRACARS